MFLQKHKDLVLNNREAAARSPSVLHKYLWLASYHNRTCDRLNDPGLADKLKIKKNDFEWLEEFLEESQIRD